MDSTMQPLVIIITGLPATGKTTIGKTLSEKYLLPLISKDDIKESLFDSLGYEGREWSKKLGMATYPVMYYFAESELRAKRSFIMESNFNPDFDDEILLALKDKFNCKYIIVDCISNGEILYKRFVYRAKSGERHKGHGDDSNHEEFKDLLLRGESKMLNIGAEAIEVNTTNIDAIDLSNICNTIETFLNKS